MKLACIVLVLAGLFTPQASAQSLRQHIEGLDGIFSTAERNAATDSLREEEAAIFIQSDDALLKITVQSEPIGVASLCLATDGLVRVLHASAALGMLEYHMDGQTWGTERVFEWAMRDTALTPSALEARRTYLEANGWVATTSRMGNEEETEFLIRHDFLPEGPLYLGLGIMPMARPMEIIGLPSASAGDCARGDLVRGPAPQSGLRFEPVSWKPVERH